MMVMMITAISEQLVMSDILLVPSSSPSLCPIHTADVDIASAELTESAIVGDSFQFLSPKRYKS